MAMCDSKQQSTRSVVIKRPDPSLFCLARPLQTATRGAALFFRCFIPHGRPHNFCGGIYVQLPDRVPSFPYQAMSLHPIRGPRKQIPTAALIKTWDEVVSALIRWIPGTVGEFQRLDGREPRSNAAYILLAHVIQRSEC